MSFLSWIGTGSSILGSFLIAFGLMFVGYCCFLVGATCWLIVGCVRKDWSLLTLNLFFAGANIIGFVRNFP